MECERPWVWSGQVWNAPSFQSVSRCGCGLVIVEIKRLEIVHARDEEPMAKGVLVVPVIGGLEYPHRILALSVVVPMALPAELIAGLCGQILGCDDLRLIRRLRVLRTRSVATLTGDIQVFVIPVGDDRFVARKVLCFDRNAGGVAPGAISGERIIGLRPIFRGFLPEHRERQPHLLPAPSNPWGCRPA